MRSSDWLGSCGARSAAEITQTCSADAMEQSRFCDTLSEHVRAGTWVQEHITYMQSPDTSTGHPHDPRLGLFLPLLLRVSLRSRARARRLRARSIHDGKSVVQRLWHVHQDFCTVCARALPAAASGVTILPDDVVPEKFAAPLAISWTRVAVFSPPHANLVVCPLPLHGPSLPVPNFLSASTGSWRLRATQHACRSRWARASRHTNRPGLGLDYYMYR